MTVLSIKSPLARVTRFNETTHSLVRGMEVGLGKERDGSVKRLQVLEEDRETDADTDIRRHTDGLTDSVCVSE